MGCNCGKRRRPAGAGRGKPESKAGKRERAESFELQTPDGQRRTFGSRLEASAERVRAGGGRITLRK